jgi:hypothetical protein
LPGVGKCRFEPPAAGRGLYGPSTGLKHCQSASRQGNSESSHVLVAETPDLLVRGSDRLIGHHLRFEPRSIFGLGLYVTRKSEASASSEVNWHTAGDPYPRH